MLNFNMAGIVYLRTDRFEVKLEGIKFSAKDFQLLCSADFLFPNGKIWARPPVVGIDVMCHPRDPKIILVLLCFGVGCVILKFNSGDVLPQSIFKFFTDGRIRFVGFGIPEKKHLFPLEELGLTENKVDLGYLAAKLLDDPKYKRYDLAELARRVLRVKNMIGLTASSSFERQEQVKCAICQLFITSAIAMALLGKTNKTNLDNAPKKSTSFLRNLNQFPLFTEGWFNFPKIKKIRDKDHDKKVHDFPLQTTFTWGLFENGIVDAKGDDGTSDDDPFHGKSVDIPYGDDDDLFRAKGSEGFFDDAFKGFKYKEGFFGDYFKGFKYKEGFFGDAFKRFKYKDGCRNNNHCKEAFGTERKPLKGILKSSSSARFEVFDQCISRQDSGLNSSESSSQETATAKKTLKRANSKGHNVSFKW